MVLTESQVSTLGLFRDLDVRVAPEVVADESLATSETGVLAVGVLGTGPEPSVQARAELVDDRDPFTPPSMLRLRARALRGIGAQKAAAVRSEVRARRHEVMSLYAGPRSTDR